MNNYPEKIKTISRLLQERTAVFPVRDSSYERLSSELRVFAEELIAETDFDNFKHDAGLVEDVLRLSESPVFICGSMKSGTTLLCHLLDSHPELLVMPGDSHFLDLLEKWDRSQFKELAVYWVHRLVNPTGQEPFWFFGQREETFKLFLAYLDHFLRNSDKAAFVCVVMAFHAVDTALSGASRRSYWVEKTPHNELRAIELSRMFPKAKFIHVLRDPLNNIVSLRKLDMYREWRGSALDHARVIRSLFRAAQTNLATLGAERYFVFKYEDLTRDPSAVMGRLCAFLNIPFDQTLLTPTESGKPAVSNSMFQKDRVRGEILDRGQNDRYRNELTRKELRNIVTSLYTDALEAGYEWNSRGLLPYKKTGVSYFLHAMTERLDDIAFKVRSGFIKN